MSEVTRQGMYIEKIDGSCIRFEPMVNYNTQSGGAETTVNAVIVEVAESTPSTNFWGSLAACNRFSITFTRMG